MTPDEISRMDNKNCIIFIRGELPFFSVKYDYPRHPNYKYTGDKDDSKLFNVKKMIQTGETKSVIETTKYTHREELREMAIYTDTSYVNEEEKRRAYANYRKMEERKQHEKERILEQERKRRNKWMQEKNISTKETVGKPTESSVELFKETASAEEIDRYTVAEVSSEFAGDEE